MPRVYAPKRYVRRADWSALSQSVERSLRCGEVGFGCCEQVTGFLHQVRGSAVDVAVVGELALEAADLLLLLGNDLFETCPLGVYVDLVGETREENL